ncbi:MAG: hypothetical protein HYV19_08660 [Gemmatimonadetes bacterium]|nr:hypothetical protein [Gemmatimonadota bacterium]
MPLLETLADLTQPWAKFYSKSHAAQTVVMFTHLAGLLGGGGVAIAADRAVWKARTATDEARARLLAEISASHRPVIIGLAMAAVSGVLMAAADVETYLPSLIFWGKMTALALLLANGAWLQSLERGAQRAPATFGKAWPRLALASRFSYVLWFAVVLGGVLLMNA